MIKRTGEFGAKELMMTGKRFKVKEAEKWRLVNHSVAEKDLENTLTKLIDQLLTSAPQAVMQTKDLIREVLEKEIDELSDLTAKKIAELRASKEGQEGMASFLEKRRPNWVKK